MSGDVESTVTWHLDLDQGEASYSARSAPKTAMVLEPFGQAKLVTHRDFSGLPDEAVEKPSRASDAIVGFRD
jgi:hypothetical protein